MPLFKVTGRYWVALHLADFLDTGARAKSRDGAEGGNEGLKRTADDADTRVRETREVGGRSSWGVVGITNKESMERRDSLTGASVSIADLSLSPSLTITVPSALSDSAFAAGLSPSPQRGGTGTGIGIGTGISGALFGREDGDFSVPVGVSSKRRKLEEEGRPLSRINSLELDSHGLAHEQQGEEKEKMKWTPGAVTGSSVGGFAMPTGLGVSSSKRVVGKKDSSLSVKEREKERDAMRSGEREEEEERSGERRLLYEESVRHTTLALDMSLSHIHKFVGHRYDHDMYTQVRYSNSMQCNAWLSTRR